MDKCTKKSFDSANEANLRIKEIRDTSYIDNFNAKRPKRVYLCSKCGKYHITSITNEQKKLIVAKKESVAKRYGQDLVAKKYGDDLPKFEKIKKKSK